jgi:hypothetical protein
MITFRLRLSAKIERITVDRERFLAHRDKNCTVEFY